MFKQKNLSFADATITLTKNGKTKIFPATDEADMLADGWAPVLQEPEASGDDPMKDVEIQQAIAKGSVDAETAFKLGKRTAAMLGTYTPPDGMNENDEFEVVLQNVKGNVFEAKKSGKGTQPIFVGKGTLSLPNGTKHVQRFLAPRNGNPTDYVAGKIIKLKIIKTERGLLVSADL